jgi:hypothetical protein
VPTEFEKLGKYNIGVTAAVETDRISQDWIDKSNQMDLIIVPSKHSLGVMSKTVIELHNQYTGERLYKRIEKPIVICEEGINTKIFKKFDEEEFKIVNEFF